MDHYEELGIASDASEDEIRRAHRRMTKLLHPDQHMDESLKQLAELQMRRLNSIVSVLLDPVSRRNYDEQLRAGVAPTARAGSRRKLSWLWWAGSIAAAMVLTVVVVLFWANNLGSSLFGSRNPTYIPPDSHEVPASAAEVGPPPASPQAQPMAHQDSPTVVRTVSPPKSETVAKVPTPKKNQKILQAKVEPPQKPTTPSSHRALVLPASALVIPRQSTPRPVEVPAPPGVALSNTARLEAANLPVASLPTPGPRPADPPPPAKPTVSTDPLEGEWVYAPTEPEKRKAGFYPPEYIDLKLFRDNGHLQGQYRARYHVADKPISPDVEFSMTPDSSGNAFVWHGKNGTRGTLKISEIDPNVIRIEWRTTVFAKQPALTAGTATLVKRE